MAVAFPTSTQATSTDSGGGSSVSVSVNPPSGLAAGDTWIIVAVVDTGSGATIQTPSGFTPAHAQVVGSPGYPSVRTFAKIAGAGESAVTVSSTGGQNWIMWCASIRVTGAHASTPIGNVSTTNPVGSGNTLDAPDITIQNAGSAALLIYAGSPNTNGTVSFSAPSGATLLQNRSGSGTTTFPVGAVAYELRDAGSYAPGNWNTNITCEGRVGITIEILPAATGGAFTLTCDAGSYALTGQDVTLTHSAAPAALDAEPGSYALTGQAVGLSAARVLDCESGSYVLTGSDAAVDTAITASPGSYALTGQDVQLGAARVMSAEPGSYALTGQDVTLTHGAIGAFTLTAEPGAYTLSGQAAILGAAHRLAAAFGTYTYVGQDATFHVARGLTCDFGSYVLTGQPVTLTANAASVLPPASRRVRVAAPSRTVIVRPRTSITFH